MAIVSVRMPDSLKERAKKLSLLENVSMNHLLSHLLTKAISYEEAIRFFENKLNGVNKEYIEKSHRVFVSKTTDKKEPSPEKIRGILKK